MVTPVFLFILVVLPYVCVAYTPTDAAALRTDIFAANYSTKDRPQNTTIINLSFGLFHITEFDIITQRLHCVGFLVAEWTDDRLQWNATDFGNMQDFFVLLSDIWSPPLMICNSADEITMINDIEEMASTNVLLTHDGNVTWMAPASIEAQCSVNIKYFPYDSQDCVIVVTSWLFFKTHISFDISRSSPIFYDLYEVNGEWDITSSSSEEQVIAGVEMAAVHFNLHLKRKYSYYVVNMMLPVIILSALGPLVFMLPVESGEKIGFTLTILLSLSVVMTQVSDSIPPTSTNVCLLSVYLLLTFILCSFETVLTVVACTFHDYHNRGLQMKQPWQTIARRLAKVTLFREHIDKSREDEPASNLTIAVEDEINSPMELSKEELKDKAWDANSDNDTDDEILYTFADLVDLIDRVHLYAFSVVTFLLITIFSTASVVGGSV